MQLYRETWDPNPEWQRDLERLAPRSERINWLLIHWEPGCPWEPVQRWEIREMIPRLEHVPEEIIEEYQGPNPRTRGRFVERQDDDGTTVKEWTSDSLVSLRQWELFQQTGCHSQRFWVIQGKHGGHKFTFNLREKKFLAGKGLPSDTPSPGALPYAEYDSRVFAKIAECDRLHQWRHSLDWDQRSERKTDAGLWVKRDRHAEEQDFNEAWLKWWDGQIEGFVSDLPLSAIPRPSDYGRYDGHYNADQEQLERSLTLPEG